MVDIVAMVVCEMAYSELQHLCQAQCAHCLASHSIYVVIVSWLRRCRGCRMVGVLLGSGSLDLIGVSDNTKGYR